jgi:DnaA-homolog protein
VASIEGCPAGVGVTREDLPLPGGQLPLGIELSLETRLEDFVADGNEAALSAAHASASAELRDCLYFAGAPATGKTHLLQAICRQAHDQGERAAYLPLKQEALRSPELLAGWEGLDLVCIDDLDPMAGDQAWERALFSLFEGLREHGGRLVVAASALPGGLGLALPDLASRLASGPVYQLSSLSDEGRTRALRERLARRGLDLSPDSARWLLRRSKRDMHTLMDLADRLDRLSLSAQRRLTVPFLRQVLSDIP